ncbi:DnaJ domain protein [Oesophagostomum dentatum]|uniref:DnaJ domain protein n=1 Tax=Oesophagostomum dentatum TaxID=61180 RepID=A0A0B1TAQ3_OESDE|nr:DnaJ domain protein [Oesophagostomum dentatum]
MIVLSRTGLPAKRCATLVLNHIAPLSTCLSDIQLKRPTLLRRRTPSESLNRRSFHSSRPSSKEDYYKTLGIKRDASAKEIKKAYFQVLSDDNKRQEYDTFGSGASSAGGMGGRGNEWQYKGTVDVNEIFRRAFGFGRDGGFNWDSFADSQFGHSHAQEMVMDISFEEAVRGTQKNIFVNVVEDCPRCKGTQVEPGYKKVCHNFIFMKGKIVLPEF